jgi:hypothetical protein
MVREEDAAALVVVVAQALAVQGLDPKITAENSVRLMRLGALMRDAFGIGTERKEENDG